MSDITKSNIPIGSHDVPEATNVLISEFDQDLFGPEIVYQKNDNLRSYGNASDLYTDTYVRGHKNGSGLGALKGRGSLIINNSSPGPDTFNLNQKLETYESVRRSFDVSLPVEVEECQDYIPSLYDVSSALVQSHQHGQKSVSRGVHDIPYYKDYVTLGSMTDDAIYDNNKNDLIGVTANEFKYGNQSKNARNINNKSVGLPGPSEVSLKSNVGVKSKADPFRSRGFIESGKFAGKYSVI